MQELGTSPEGLSSTEAQNRLTTYGYNELVAKKKRTALNMIVDELKDIFVLLLIVATILSAIIGYYEMAVLGTADFFEAYADAVIIGVLIVIVVIMGFVQEYRAEKAIDAMKKL